MHQIFFISTDTEIINDLQENYSARMAAEKIFYNRYTYFIEEACRKHNLSYDDSFSAYSDAVLSTIHNIILNKFDGRSTLKTYLFQIFSNKCVDYIRKKTTYKHQVHYNTIDSELIGQLPDTARTIVDKLIDHQKQHIVKQQLETIGSKCKEILLLFEDCFTDKQIAIELQYSNAAVAKTTRLRCLEKLREKTSSLLIKMY